MAYARVRKASPLDICSVWCRTGGMKRLTLLLCTGLLLGLSACTQPVTTPPTTDPPTTTPPTTPVDPIPPTTPVDPTPPTNPTPPTDPTPPTTPPTNPIPTAPFIPAPGAAVGSGNSSPEGTVYLSPTAEEIQVLQFINEIRTTGKMNGVDVTAGTCIEGKFTPLKPLSYSGVLSYMARKHSSYMSNVAYEGHSENNSSSPYFYGTTINDRKTKAYRELGVSEVYGAGEIVITGRTSPEQAVKDWMHSSGHCNVITYSSLTNFGAGHSYASADTQNNRWGDSWTVNVF